MFMFPHVAISLLDWQSWQESEIHQNQVRPARVWYDQFHNEPPQLPHQKAHQYQLAKNIPAAAIPHSTHRNSYS